jgi:hypothetical protein
MGKIEMKKMMERTNRISIVLPEGSTVEAGHLTPSSRIG